MFSPQLNILKPNPKLEQLIWHEKNVNTSWEMCLPKANATLHSKGESKKDEIESTREKIGKKNFARK